MLVTVVAAVASLTFMMLALIPGDPIAAMLGDDAPPATVDALRAELRLDDPLHERFGAWIADVVQGDLGRSLVHERPVREMIARALPVSLQLMVMAQVLALSAAVPLALLAVRRPDGVLDRASSTVALGMIATPAFVIAVVLIYVVSVRFGWLPATGFNRLSDGVVDNLRTALLPAVVLATGPFGVYYRILRSDLITTAQEDYVMLARAQGLTPRTVVVRHVLKPSTLPLITTVGLRRCGWLGPLVGGLGVVDCGRAEASSCLELPVCSNDGADTVA